MMNFSRRAEDLLITEQLFSEHDLVEDPPFEFQSARHGAAEADANSSSAPWNLQEVSTAIGNVAGNAYLTAATTDLAISVDKGLADREKYADLQLYLPTEVNDLRKPLATLLKIVGKDYVFGDMMLLPARMQFGMRMAAMLTADPADQRISSDVFADAWKHIAGGMLEAAGLCDQVQTRCEKRIHDLSVPKQLLNGVLAGKHPCMDRTGKLSVPNWAERRGSRRYPCNIDVSVVSEQQAQTGAIKNFSDRGLGITGLSGFEINEKVTVKRQDGDDILGRIQRVDKTWVGVLMDKALFFDDPLYNCVPEVTQAPSNS